MTSTASVCANPEGFDLAELDLVFKPSAMMGHIGPVVRQAGNRLIVGYLADDDETTGNPLEDMDGVGHIYTAHRHSDTHHQMQDALGLDRDWQPRLDEVDNFEDRLGRAWIEAAKVAYEFKTFAQDNASARAPLDTHYFARRAEQFWKSHGIDGIDEFDFTRDVREALWRDLRHEGKMGDIDAVLLDCYEHSGQHWSISGEGMRCRFDTASGAGVWVPDTCVREEIERRAPAYAYGEVQRSGVRTRQSNPKRYFARFDKEFGAEQSPRFEHWHEAFDWLNEQVADRDLPAPNDQQARLGRRRAAIENARSALDLYNQWLSGDIYGCIVLTVEYHQSTESWEILESDECWGYFGFDDTMDELRSTVESEADWSVSPNV